jgi:hypothetical protein
VRQFIHSIGAHVTPADYEFVNNTLPPEAASLFESLSPGDQRHGLDVARALVARGEGDPDLLAAALLHDAGKAGAGLTIFHRVAIVLLQAAKPEWLASLSRQGEGAWRRPFWAHRHHGEIGAALARQAGCSETTIWLIAHHHEHVAEVADASRRQLLDTLQREDNTH